MKKSILYAGLVFTTAALFTACGNKAEQQNENTANDTTAAEAAYIVDAAASKVQWTGTMLNMYSHTGTVAIKSGNISTKGGQLASGSFTIDMSSITPTDSNYDNKDRTKEKLVGHLSAPDFFDVTNHPEATFVINSVSGNEAKGTLTIRGKSNEETIKNVEIREEGDNIIAKGSLIFDRKKYDVSFDMSVKDMVLSNDIELAIEIAGKK